MRSNDINAPMLLLIRGPFNHCDSSFRLGDLLKNFMSENLGTSPDMPSKGDFSFANSAAELTSNLIDSLVIDLAVDLDFEFGLDLAPIFNADANSILDRIPDPFIQVNQFSLDGENTFRFEYVLSSRCADFYLLF